MRPFAYAAPTSLDDALAALQRWGPDARLLAGGTDLLVAMRERGLHAGCLVDLKRIPGLAEIGPAPHGGLHLGALVLVRALERSPLVRDRFPVLAEAAHLLASVQVRNLATLGGNLSNASPAADLAPPLLVLDAIAEIAGSEGVRRIPLREFFIGPGRTVLNGDILTGVSVPRPAPGLRAVYLKHGPRQAMDIAIVGVAASATVDPATRRWSDVRIALGAVAPTPLRAERAEALLSGQPVTPERIEAAAALAAEESQPITDLRGSAEYRRSMVAVLTRRAVEMVSR